MIFCINNVSFTKIESKKMRIKLIIKIKKKIRLMQREKKN